MTRFIAQATPDLLPRRHTPTTTVSRNGRGNFLYACVAVAAVLHVLVSTTTLNGWYRRMMQESTAVGMSDEGGAIQYSYLDPPELLWSSQDKSSPIGRGNAVVQSPFDEDLIYATTRSGKLAAYSLSRGEEVWSFLPGPRVSTNGETGETESWSILCQSSISFGKLDNVGGFMVYAIIDEPPAGSIRPPESRVVAITLPDHEQFWESGALSGIAQGTPVVNSDHGSTGPKYIMLTHNVQIDMASPQVSDATPQATTAVIQGHITILEANNGKMLWTEPESLHTRAPIGYGPVGIARDLPTGKLPNQNANDVAVWANAGDEEMDGIGSIYALQLPEFFDGTQMITLFSTHVKGTDWNAGTRPVFSSIGNMYLGVSQSQMRAWVGDTPLDNSATWRVKFMPNELDPWRIVPLAPILSLDEKRLYMASANNELVGMDALTGSLLWEDFSSSSVSGLQVSLDDKYIYSIDSIDGTITCRDQRNGAILWSAGCESIEGGCSHPVNGNFAVSTIVSNGIQTQFLAYGDEVGRISVLKLGSEIVDAPTASPTTEEPTAEPSATPTPDTELRDPEPELPSILDASKNSGIVPNAPDSNANQNTAFGMLGAILLLIASTLALIVVVVFVIIFQRVRHNRNKPTGGKLGRRFFSKANRDGDFLVTPISEGSDSGLGIQRTSSGSSDGSGGPNSRAFNFGPLSPPKSGAPLVPPTSPGTPGSTGVDYSFGASMML